MHATLVYNQQAGHSGQPAPDQILEALGQAGFETAYLPTATEADLDQALSQAKDLVVVAGGDGSVRAVAIRLLGRDIGITPLPMGTANNIARVLGLVSNPLTIIAGLADPVMRTMDIGRVKIARHTHYFLEALGIGVFADGMKKYKPEDGKSVLRGLRSALETLQGYQPKFFHLSLDGEDYSGSYVLVEVMNTPTMGLHYQLAPQADLEDGLLDLVLIHANQRENYLRFATGALSGNLTALPNVSSQRGSRVEIAWRGFPLHIDGEIWDELPQEYEVPPNTPAQEQLDVAGPFISVDVLRHAIHFWLPREHATEIDTGIVEGTKEQL